jgi:myo-inositol-1(or 4)-monophosphatase
MTAIDFAAFVDRLAAVSGDAILPFFRTSLGIENKPPTAPPKPRCGR